MTQVHTNAGLDPTRKDFYRRLLREMLLIRRFEEKAGEAYALGQIGGFCHLYIGQEAVAVGCIGALREDDYVTASYREHGHALTRGMSARSVMAELFGKATGCSKGKGGSMHLFDAKRRFLGGHGIVGGQIPIAAGAAFAIKYRGGDQVSMCFFGEAAVNIGAFHETLNMASLWKLPAVFVVENNRYGMGTAVERASAVENIASRALSYGTEAEVVDGMDVVAVHDAAVRAVARGREQSMPTLLNVLTYRFVGHSMSDASHGTYRTLEEVEENKKNDPIGKFCGRLVDEDLFSHEEFEAMDQDVIAEVEDSVAFAESSPDPDPAELFTAVYHD
ncbi:MAG: pyruvate dehydrogenase (acetyl-transferring) E1 component subunit alpha [Gemmatimonadetes bacterium]|nr:pyruvate dehydrogenase (acetyl-transferring) E1 component subunit alpha [Gemmatimonadota bacterium]